MERGRKVTNEEIKVSAIAAAVGQPLVITYDDGSSRSVGRVMRFVDCVPEVKRKINGITTCGIIDYGAIYSNFPPLDHHPKGRSRFKH